jgi:PAS domain S-box-containing protein
MSKKKVLKTADAELRRRAEEQLGEEPGTAHPAGKGEEPLRLSHELQVHQIELEMQNAELCQARDDVATLLEKYTDLYEFAPVGYFTLDRIGTILSVNFTGAGLLGLERSRLLGRRFGLFVTDEARPAFNAFLGKVFTGPAKEACEVALLKEGNAPLCVQIEGVAAVSGRECRIALIDITERKRAEEVLSLAKEAAEASDRAKSQFLANMSHELRTPMTGILGMLQLALEEELAPVPRGFLETTQSSARSLLRILNDNLDMAKIEEGKLAIEEKPFSPRRCITHANNIIASEVRRKGLAFAVSVAEEVPDRVVGDSLRLRQVLINLIGNAVKFTEVGKVEVRVTAGKATSDGKREFTFAVTDTGIGIADDKKDLLFRAFSQVDDSHNRRYSGTGLGLAICREIVELMGGTIGFESTEGVGSTFSFTIPLGETELKSYPLHAADSMSTETTSPAPEGERIPRLLLAEDDPTIRKALGLLFKRAHYDLDFAEDGLQAIEMWEKGRYDLVLMDVQMPRLNGFEATKAIREQERERGGHTPIIAVTAHCLKEDEDKCLAAGMDAFIAKPLDFKKCVQLIRQIIGQKPGGAS